MAIIHVSSPGSSEPQAPAPTNPEPWFRPQLGGSKRVGGREIRREQGYGWTPGLRLERFDDAPGMLRQALLLEERAHAVEQSAHRALLATAQELRDAGGWALTDAKEVEARPASDYDYLEVHADAQGFTLPSWQRREDIEKWHTPVAIAVALANSHLPPRIASQWRRHHALLCRSAYLTDLISDLAACILGLPRVTSRTLEVIALTWHGQTRHLARSGVEQARDCNFDPIPFRFHTLDLDAVAGRQG